MPTLTPEHRRVSEIEQIIDSDNAAPRCGCPVEPWPLVNMVVVLHFGVIVVVALCFGCSATWEWGEVCAQAAKEEP